MSEFRRTIVWNFLLTLRSSVEKGVLIHFLNMQNASYDLSRDTITLEPGIHWAGALAAVEPYGVAPMGGRMG